MSEQNELTGSPRRGYTGRMSESSTETEERPPQAPKTQEEMEQALSAHELEQERARDAERAVRRERRLEGGMNNLTEAQRKQPNMPDIVLRHKMSETSPDKEDWTELGWSPEDIMQVESALKVHLKIDETKAHNAVEILVASGQTPESFNERLTEWQNDKETIRTHVQTNIYQQPLQVLSTQDLDKYIFLKHVGAKRDEDGVHYDNMRDDYIQRFVLDKEFSELLERDYEENPANLDELAWNIHYFDRSEFGLNGKFPVIEMRVDKRNDGTVKGKYCINKPNYMRWIRKHMNRSEDKEPDQVTNYFADVKLNKRFRPLTLGEIIDDQVQYFTDEDGGFHSDISNQSLLEPWMMMTIKDYDVTYKTVMSNGGKLSEQMQGKFQLSKLTKNVFNRSMLYHMSTMGVDYNGTESDSKLGGAWNTMFLAYYNISDLSELKLVLGKDSSFFTRDGMMSAINDVVDAKREQTGIARITDFLGPDKLKEINDFYDEQGRLKEDYASQKGFLKFINILQVQWTDPNVVKIVNKALINAVQDMYDFTSKESNVKVNKGTDKEGKKIKDTHSLEFAALIAQTWVRFSGAGAKNDIPANGFDSASKWINTEAYRRKMATGKRGGTFGNPYTVPQFKSMMVDLVQAIRVTEAMTTKGVHGQDGETKDRRKSMLEVFNEMNSLTRILQQKRVGLQKEMSHEGTSLARKAQIDQELAGIADQEKIAYKQVAGQLEFNNLAMANYASNHMARAEKLYEQVVGAKEIDFDKFVHFDIVKGITFDRANFQKEVQEDFLKPLRYLWATYGELNFNMPVRSAVFMGRDKQGEDHRKHKTVALGEALFGYDMLNIPKFWKKDAKGKPLKKGRFHIIDYDIVQKEQTTLWKQWALMKFSGDLWAHIDRHSTDPNYDMSHYLHVIEALESIPGQVVGDEKDMRKTHIGNKFFSHEQMHWLKKMAKATTFQLGNRQFIDDLFGHKEKKGGGGVSDSFSLIANAIFRGY